MKKHEYPSWTQEEENSILTELKTYDIDTNNIATIAKNHNRTTAAVIKRLDKILLNYLKTTNKTTKELATIFNMSEDKMEQKCNRLQLKQTYQLSTDEKLDKIIDLLQTLINK